MISIGVLAKALFGSFIGRAMAIGLAALAALAVNNLYQRHKGAKIERVRIIEKTEKAGQERNAKAQTIRKKIRSSKPGTAMQRLRNEFSGSD